MSSKRESSKKKSIEDVYKKMTPHEHILKLPDTYIGGIDLETKEMRVYDEEEKRIMLREITYVPGLYKIFDEIIVNVRDHKVRDKTCKNMKVWINEKTGEITVWNDGAGIPIEIHKEHKIYIPELIFGNLLTSSHYDETNKTVGGKNGYGAKLANIYSTKFVIETVDSNNHKKYYQEFSKNMFTVEKPIVTNVEKKATPYTKISFIPDFARFGIKGLTPDIVALFKTRIYDMAACTYGLNDGMNVYLNDKKIDIGTFCDYIKLHYEKDELSHEPIYHEINPRWKLGIVYDKNAGFTHVSFVNGIKTPKGGTHVTYVSEQLVKKIMGYIKTVHKVDIKGSYIKENLTLFIDCIIEDPAFGSQTKEELTNRASTFGSKCEIDDDIMKEIAKTKLIDDVIKYAQYRESGELKKTDGKKNGSVSDIEKLDDAGWAGTRKSIYTRLILTEGDSAKKFALDGREVIGKEKYGVFPLRGKVLNVREATVKQQLENREIMYLKRIIGLKQNMSYKDTKKLRYGGIIVLADQDVDGSHIKGLIINMFHHYWPSLLKIKGFIQSMATPIIKAFKKSDVKRKNPKIFYTMSEYRKWIENDMGGDPKSKGWEIKYYKGLGTHKATEAKECFNEFEKKLVSYIWETSEGAQDKHNDNNPDDNLDDQIKDKVKDKVKDTENDEDDNETDTSHHDHEEDLNDINDTTSKSYNAITLAFAKNRINDRKNWLFNYNRNNVLDNGAQNVTFSDFINKELIHFSNYDNERSLPHMADGLKPSQRKILFAAFEKGIEKNEIKVAQFGNYAAEITEYHHGESSIQETVVGMAQNFVGSNNINLLTPNGNFGSRRLGGDDAASTRYIFTQLSPVTRKLFRKEDDPIYHYIIEDGKSIEPEFYVPILPMAIINGESGIGTGFSTNIPNFNPIDVADNILRMIDKNELKDISPYYRGFKGKIIKTGPTTYQSIGVYEVLNENTVRVTEIPLGIGLTIEKYKKDLDKELQEEKIKQTKKDKKDKKSTISKKTKKTAQKKIVIESYHNASSNNDVDFTIKFKDDGLQQLIKTNSIEKRLKLIKPINLSNMHLYNCKGAVTKYNTINSIFHDFYQLRYKTYETRKAHMIKILENQLNLLKYKIKFLEDYMKDIIIVEKKKRDEIIAKLEKLKYPRLSNNCNASESEKTYDYITDLGIFSLTVEKLDDLTQKFKEKETELDTYRKITIEELWKNEIQEFLVVYKKWLEEVATEETGNTHEDSGKTKQKRRMKAVKKS